jgi:hypothetical protein
VYLHFFGSLLGDYCAFHGVTTALFPIFLKNIHQNAKVQLCQKWADKSIQSISMQTSWRGDF